MKRPKKPGLTIHKQAMCHPSHFQGDFRDACLHYKWQLLSSVLKQSEEGKSVVDRPELKYYYRQMPLKRIP